MKSEYRVVAPFKVCVNLRLRPTFTRQGIFPSYWFEFYIVLSSVNFIKSIYYLTKPLTFTLKAARRPNEDAVYSDASRHGPLIIFSAHSGLMHLQLGKTGGRRNNRRARPYRPALDGAKMKRMPTCST